MLNKKSVNFNISINSKMCISTKIKQSKFTKPKLLNLKGINKQNHSKYLNKDNISSMKLIGQFDKKFVIMMDLKDNSIVVLDQHAIHERILFEYYSQLLSNEFTNENKIQNYSNISKSNLFKDVYSKMYLTQPLEIHDFSAANFTNLRFDSSRISNLFNYEFIVEKNKVILHTVPIIFDKILGREEYFSIFKSLMQNLNKLILVDENGDSLININNINILIDMFLNIIKSKACRDAVKFNENLDDVFLTSLVDNLGKCKNPFLCAHGRHNFFIMVEKDSTNHI